MPPPRLKRPTTRHDEILAAARELCRDGGVETLRMRALADRVGVTAPAIYRHFADKGSLLSALVEEANETFGRYLHRALEGSDPTQRLNRLIDSFLAFALERPLDYELLFFARIAMDEGRLPLNRRSPNLVFLIDRLRECMETGALRRDIDPLLAGVTLWAHVHGLISLHRQGRFEGDDAVFRSVFEASVKLVLDGLRPLEVTSSSPDGSS